LTYLDAKDGVAISSNLHDIEPGEGQDRDRNERGWRYHEGKDEEENRQEYVVEVEVTDVVFEPAMSGVRSGVRNGVRSDAMQ
jgi:hypothetical protein